MINVQFSDGAQTAIIGFFGAPQDPEVWPNMGIVAESDARWKTYYDAQPPAAQMYLPVPSA
ncbi:hypothetical protein KTE52_24705 [Burkholderia multivorans]|uniref:Uncharacterized protein n=1 Tax=Burkholderia multivorans TaxID=87883 RepID=A0AAP2HPN1_9BURK|nr:hypothetical protein [Burkholderia multivorans]MBU9359545.1 hypothetical protein [Burkholderia multivorans]